jgi:hypothetical protein
MMGGDVTVASEPGKGSVFRVRPPGSARADPTQNSCGNRCKFAAPHYGRDWHEAALCCSAQNLVAI